MTTFQLSLVLGTIWIAPHAGKISGQLTGVVLIFIGIASEVLK
jgi:hypothetical protein